MSEFRKVSRDEFDAFVSAYPKPLTYDVAGMFEPPLATYNDFTLGKWPESIVAKFCLPFMPGDAPTDFAIRTGGGDEG